MEGIRAAVIGAGHAITPLLADERVVGRWTEPSALRELSIGGLAGHLVRALETIELYLDEPEPPTDTLLDPSTYFLNALRSAGNIDSPAHRGVRERGEQAGSVGPAAVLEEHRARLDRLTSRLECEPPTRRITVMRGAARMTLDAYLPTRLVEIVVHADDLAASIGAETPSFEPEVRSTVIDVLVGVARGGHGDLAVIRAMSRRERDLVEALRVL